MLLGMLKHIKNTTPDHASYLPSSGLIQEHHKPDTHSVARIRRFKDHLPSVHTLLRCTSTSKPSRLPLGHFAQNPRDLSTNRFANCEIWIKPSMIAHRVNKKRQNAATFVTTPLASSLPVQSSSFCTLWFERSILEFLSRISSRAFG